MGGVGGLDISVRPGKARKAGKKEGNKGKLKKADDSVRTVCALQCGSGWLSG